MTTTTAKKPISSSPSSNSDSGDEKTVIDRIRKPSGQLKRLSACIYGRGGSGKTTLLGTMPGNGLVVDIPQIEGGTSVLADQKNHIDVVPIIKWNEIDDVWKHLRYGAHQYTWVAIDTITAMQELAKRKALKERGLDEDPYLVKMQDWGKIGQLMAEMFYKFKLLNIHVIFVAQEKQRGNEEGIEIVPNVSPMSLDALLPPLYVVGRMFVNQVDTEEGGMRIERQLRVGPHDIYLTKTRAVPGRELPSVVAAPNLGSIFAYLMGKKVKRPEAATDEAVGLMEIEDED